MTSRANGLQRLHGAELALPPFSEATIAGQLFHYSEAIKQAVPPRSSCATCWQPSLNIRNSVACLWLLQLGSMSLYRYNRLGDGGSCGAARKRKRCGGSCDYPSCWELGVWHVGLPGFEAL